MNGDFDELIKKLKEYEEEIDQLWQKYNPKDNGLKMELIAMKMAIVFYNYIIDCFEALNAVYKEKYLHLTCKGLTAASYILTGIAFVNAPPMVLPGILGSVGLSLRNKRCEMTTEPPITDEQSQQLLDLIDSFENNYAGLIDKIIEQVDIFEDDKVLNTLSEPERSKRITCKKLMQFLRIETPNIIIEDDKFQKQLGEIIGESLNCSSNNIYELLQQAENNYQQLNQKLVRLRRKNQRLSNIYKIIS